tara:strand:+ start:4361 stop:4825 length:465 start_codon:yes stop_codon:yes gene_type:complete
MEHFVPFEEVGMSGKSNRYDELPASQKLEVDKLINNIASKDAFLVNGSLESVLPDEELCEAFVRFGLEVLGDIYEDPTGRLRARAHQAGLLSAVKRIEDLRDVLNNPQNDEMGVCEFHADGRHGRCGSVVEHILRAYTQGQQTLLEEPVYADAD